jgi:hypothetical protein
MASTICLDDLHIVVLGQAFVDHDGISGRHRGRKGVHNEEEAQGKSRYQGCDEGHAKNMF